MLDNRHEVNVRKRSFRSKWEKEWMIDWCSVSANKFNITFWCIYKSGTSFVYLCHFGDTLEILSSGKLVCYQVSKFCCLQIIFSLTVFLVEIRIFCMVLFCYFRKHLMQNHFWLQLKTMRDTNVYCRISKKRKRYGYSLYIRMFSSWGLPIIFFSILDCWSHIRLSVSS
jgi:hypothetical protein